MRTTEGRWELPETRDGVELRGITSTGVRLACLALTAKDAQQVARLLGAHAEKTDSRPGPSQAGAR